MGMFDNLRCEYPLPGLKDPTSIQFQTKDTENQFLEDFRITAAGVLEIEEYDVEDRSDPNAEGIARIFGMMTRIPKGWKRVDFTGSLNFYGDATTGGVFLYHPDGKIGMFTEEGEVAVPQVEWFEYEATFDHGKLISIERITEEI